MTKINFMRLTHAEIYLNNLKDNFLSIKALLKPQTKICAAVKADGYGNGAVNCAKTLVEAGADFLAVANVEDGAAQSLHVVAMEELGKFRWIVFASVFARFR